MIFTTRILFTALLLFELLNGFGVLHVPLDFSWFGLIVTGAVAWGMVEVLFGSGERKDHLATALMVAFGGVLLDAAGDVFHLYARINWYDRALHLLSGVASAYLVYLLIRKKAFLKGVLLWVMTIGAANLLGSLYEIEEWLEDAFVHGRVLRLGDGPDTADDLLMNILGAVILMGIITIYEKRKEKHTE